MSVWTFTELNAHYGHEVEIARYGDTERIWNVAIECMTCNEVLLDFNNDEEEEKNG